MCSWIKKFQRANWGERPLHSGQLAYAQRDTHYLFQLRDYLLDQLAEQDRLAEAEELFCTPDPRTAV